MIPNVNAGAERVRAANMKSGSFQRKNITLGLLARDGNGWTFLDPSFRRAHDWRWIQTPARSRPTLLPKLPRS